MIINPKDYNPAVRGESDKYSWNIYRVLNHWKGQDVRAVILGWNWVHGECELHDGTLQLINASEPFDTGNDINRIRTKGLSAAKVCVVSYSGKPRSKFAQEDVTEDFFKDYRRVGLCSGFFKRPEHRWLKINRNSRKCLNCGQHEWREVQTVRQYVRQEVWFTPESISEATA